MVLGGSGEGSTGNDIPIVLREALGLNIKLIAGYPDSNALYPRRRSQGSGWTDRRNFGHRILASGMARTDSPVRMLLQFARVTRHPQYSDVPTARELALNDRARVR